MKLVLLDKTNNDWWSIRKENGVTGYVPKNYVKILPEKKIETSVESKTVKVEKKVKVMKQGFKEEEVTKKRKVEKKKTVRRSPSDTDLWKILRRSIVRNQANLHFDKINVEQRQLSINNAYKDLVFLSETRRLRLEEHEDFYHFLQECDNLETFIKGKEVSLQTTESLSVQRESMKRRFEAVITDIAANVHVLDEINDSANKMRGNNHGESVQIAKRQQQVNDRWQHMMKLKLEREKTLEGASSIDIFQDQCGELRDWIGEKRAILSADDPLNSLEKVKALQRKQENLEHELKPLEAKIKKMHLLGASVKHSYPGEAEHVNREEEEIMLQWQDLQEKSQNKNKKLADAERLQNFLLKTREIDNWSSKMREFLNEKEIARDYNEAEILLKNHAELSSEINDYSNKYDSAIQLGKEIISTNQNEEENVVHKIDDLKIDYDDIKALWANKLSELNNISEYQNFLREADQINSVTASHEAFLEFNDLGTTVDGVEGLIKRQGEFENRLNAQKDRLTSFDKTADKLISGNHPDTDSITKKRQEVIERRKKVVEKCKQRCLALEQSSNLQKFNRDSDELADWIEDKYKIATDESYRDLTNLLPKVQKHQAFEAELQANKANLDDINCTGNEMITAKHPSKDSINKTLTNLNDRWTSLAQASSDKDVRLRQAAQQEMLNDALERALERLNEMERSVASQAVGKDLRSVRDLLKKHQFLEGEMDISADNLKNLEKQGKDMEREGHFDSKSILKSIKDFDRRFNALRAPVAERREKLEASLLWHQFNFDADTELLWIDEHIPMTSSTDYGKSLSDTQILNAKHKKLELALQSHQPKVEFVIKSGISLINQKHFAKDEIQIKKDHLDNEWNKLLDLANDRKNKINGSSHKEAYLSRINDLETILNEKERQISGDDYGRDETASNKLINKNKLIEDEMVICKKNLNDIQNESIKVQQSNPTLSEDIITKQTALESQLHNVDEAIKNRGEILKETCLYHSYMKQCIEFEEWMSKEMITATSDEYGQDYEHLQGILNKFEEFQLGIEAGNEIYNDCDKKGEELIKRNKFPYINEVETRREEITDGWNKLLNEIQTRKEKLEAAGEIHRYNRDVEETLSRIQEKYTEIPEEIGRDINGVLVYQKKQDVFENELVALEAQVQVLIDDSARLQQSYPGQNAEEIASKEAVVNENWSILTEKMSKRKENLTEASDLYRFTISARDLILWSQSARTSMQAKDSVRDVTAVDLLKNDHKELLSEIETRKPLFVDTMKAGNIMVSNNHNASNEINIKLVELSNELDLLEKSWNERQTWLESLHDSQSFMRDARYLDRLSTSQEVYLKSTEFGDTVEHVEALMKRHDAFEKLILAQHLKLNSLQEFGDKLINEHHFDSDNISSTLESTKSRRNQIKTMSKVRNHNLNNSLLCAQFKRDAAEAESWIEDKLVIADEEGLKNIEDLQKKMKALQKHQAFEAEIMANKDLIENVGKMGRELVKRNHVESNDISARVNDIEEKWRRLLEATSNRGKSLEGARDILRFNEEVDIAETWIREKESLVSAGEIGRDYEHCLELIKKLTDSQSTVTVDSTRIKDINKLADKLISQGRTDTKTIEVKRDALNKRWENVEQLLNEHNIKLNGALEVHSFNRDVDDLNDRINDKCIAMCSEDCGKDVTGVEILLRKQEVMERDITVLHSTLEKLVSTSDILCKKYPESSELTDNKLKEAKENWEKLEDLTNRRKLRLDDSYQVQKFMAKSKEQMLWAQNLTYIMNTQEMAKDVLRAEQILQLHQERKSEIDGRYNNYTTLKQQGDELYAVSALTNGSPTDGRGDEFKSSSPSILSPISPNKVINRGELLKNRLRKLDESWTTVELSWEEKKLLLTQGYDLQVYEEYGEQADLWLASKEAFLANEDLGSNLTDIADLLQKHESFAATLEAQQDKIITLKQLADALLAQDHYASNQIKERSNGVEGRLEKIKILALKRQDILNESLYYQQFLANTHEVKLWISTKLTIASDESYYELTNLKRKNQKQQVFEAELVANKRRIETCNEEGNKLINDDNYAAKEIDSEIKSLESKWTILNDQSKLKSIRLQQAYQAMQFNRQCENITEWTDDIETQLSSVDHGKDVTSANSLLKKHQELQEDITKYSEKVNDLNNQVRVFKEEEHFLCAELEEKESLIKERYDNLSEPCQIRNDNLVDAIQLYSLNRDIDDELTWINECKVIASSENLGDSLTSVQNLQKKHTALDLEISSHVKLVKIISDSANKMISAKHFSSDEIETSRNNLKNEMNSLKKISETRRINLLNSVESQMYFLENKEACSWIDEKTPTLTSSDLGKDQDSVQGYLKRLAALKLDVEKFKETIDKLSSLSSGLVTRHHFDSVNIESKQMDIEKKYTEILKLLKHRQDTLEAHSKLFKFIQKCDEFIDLLKDKRNIASSDDFGTDLEHVEILIKKFNEFTNDFKKIEPRMKILLLSGDQLKEEGETSHLVDERSASVKQLYEEVNEQSSLRKEALDGALQVHVFIRDADDTIEWTQEKQLLMTTETFGNLETVQKMLAKHHGYEQDLAAISDQVEHNTNEAERLLKQFPEAHEHVRNKHEQMVAEWDALLEKAKLRKEKLILAENLQIYFNEYRTLIAWCNEITGIISSEDIAKDVSGAELSLRKHQELKAEIDTRQKDINRFTLNGQRTIKDGHFLSSEIQEKIDCLSIKVETLLKLWKQRQNIYEQNLDLQQLKYDMDQLEAWLMSRESTLNDETLIDSIEVIDELLRKHADFEKAVDAYAQKFESVKRLTKVEEAYIDKIKANEEVIKAKEMEIEKERLNELKKQEQLRILKEREIESDDKKTDTLKKQTLIAHDEPDTIKVNNKVTKVPSFKKESIVSPSLSRKEPESMSAQDMARLQLSPKTPHSHLKPVTKSLSMRAFRKTPKHEGEFELPSSLPPASFEGEIERKQELQIGGKRATMRNWRSFYCCVIEHNLYLFKDKLAYTDKSLCSNILVLTSSACELSEPYKSRKNLLRIHLADGSEYLLMLQSKQEVTDCCNSIQSAAVLTWQGDEQHIVLTPKQLDFGMESSGSDLSPEPVINEAAIDCPPIIEAEKDIELSEQSSITPESPISSYEIVSPAAPVTQVTPVTPEQIKRSDSQSSAQTSVIDSRRNSRASMTTTPRNGHDKLQDSKTSSSKKRHSVFGLFKKKKSEK